MAPAHTFALNSLDPEGFALTPDGQSVWVASEGFKASGVQPFITPLRPRYRAAGGAAGRQPAAELSVPTPATRSLTPRTPPPGRATTWRSNLWRSPRAGHACTPRTKARSYQDGPAAAFGVQSNVRLAAYDPATGARTAEYLYRTGPVVVQPNRPARSR
jgi:hypothetical protein